VSRGESEANREVWLKFYYRKSACSSTTNASFDHAGLIIAEFWDHVHGQRPPDNPPVQPHGPVVTNEAASEAPN
jgi:hypothetical protein